MGDYARFARDGDQAISRVVPRCRSWSDFRSERVGEDLVLFDDRTMQYHTLNSSAERIWRACDGVATVDVIASAMALSVEVVEITLADLVDASLLEIPAGSWTVSMERRRAIGLIAAGLAGIPVTRSITAPEAASAASASYCFSHGYLEATCVNEWDCQMKCPPHSVATCIQVDASGIGCCKCGNTSPGPIDGQG